MDYVSPVNELEQRLKEAGEHLAAFTPSSTKDLLHILDKTEQLLTFVSQAPSIAMQGALVPSMEALFSDGLLKHTELDVRVSVASCLCEVARITAPQPPYKDEIMKEIFKLNVLAFGQLSNMTSECYRKAIHILESVAKVKSCLLMLDLECDALVFEMFEKFLSQIRVNHPPTVFSDVEAIMTVIIQESDEIATELLSLLISHVKKENQIVTPASWKVAEKVLRNCKDTLKSYYETITKLVNSNPDDYAEVVTVLCQKPLENDPMVIRSTRTNSTHKRDRNTLENGGSTKKQKFVDKNQFKGKELETSRRGRPRKNKNILNQYDSPKSVQNSQENLRRTGFQDKKQLSKTKGDIGNSGSLYNAVTKMEDESLSDFDGSGPLTQQMSNIKKRRRKSSSNTHASNGSRGKEIPKKWGQDLVGHRINVWWPLDKMYYEGAVSSYNSLDDKHKVLYADGDEEVLDLHREKWMMLAEISLNQEKVADLPRLRSTPAKRRKPNRKGNLKSSLKQEDISDSPKSLPPADSSKTVDAICNADNHKNNSVSTPADSSKTATDNHKNGLASSPADSSKTAYDKYKSNLVSCGLKLTEKEADDMEKNGDLNTNGDLQEKKPDESSETTQNLEKTENLNFEI
ncbi:sister chromatid cohesion protein PDS5 homolog D-like isoform X2 [Bidens hawaiensis]|uniref:sister chromatid cohesion protein PDS5 homolog D-like isoform X2 n=1 Tax=Bidens hawaiensis TaxID=980011 RepID=UPI0040491205